jgi:hypothetical protein
LLQVTSCITETSPSFYFWTLPKIRLSEVYFDEYAFHDRSLKIDILDIASGFMEP